MKKQDSHNKAIFGKKGWGWALHVLINDLRTNRRKIWRCMDYVPRDDFIQFADREFPGIITDLDGNRTANAEMFIQIARRATDAERRAELAPLTAQRDLRAEALRYAQASSTAMNNQRLRCDPQQRLYRLPLRCKMMLRTHFGRHKQAYPRHLALAEDDEDSAPEEPTINQIVVDSSWAETYADRDADKAHLAGICVQNCAYVRSLREIPKTIRWTMWDVMLGLAQLAQQPPSVAEIRKFTLSWSTMTSKQAAEFFTSTMETAHVRPYVILMNFANAKFGGGGYQSGDRAQEESLCREYPVLFHSLRQYYHPKNDNMWSRNYPMTHSSDVLVTDPIIGLRGDQGNNFVPYCEAEQHMASFVSAAAPNLRSKAAKFMPEVLRQQIRNIIYAPLLNKIQQVQEVRAPWQHHTMEDSILVLGAWGCGAFGNDPWVIGTMFAEVLAGIMGEVHNNPGLQSIWYREIHFAIPVMQPDDLDNPEGFRLPLLRLAEALGTDLRYYNTENLQDESTIPRVLYIPDEDEEDEDDGGGSPPGGTGGGFASSGPPAARPAKPPPPTPPNTGKHFLYEEPAARDRPLWEWCLQARISEQDSDALPPNEWCVYEMDHNVGIECAYNDREKHLDITVGIRECTIVFRANSRFATQSDTKMKTKRLVRRRLVTLEEYEAAFTTQAANMPMDQESCTLCTDTFAATSNMPTFVMPGCQHAFHQVCALQLAKNHDQCPICRSDVDWRSIPCFNQARHAAGGSGGTSSGSQTARQPWSPSVPPPQPPGAAPASTPASNQETEFEDFGPGPGGRSGAGAFQNLRISSGATQGALEVRPNARDRRTIPEEERQPDPPPQRRKGGNPPHESKGSKGAKGSGKWDNQQWRRQSSWDTWSGGAWKKGRWDGR